MHPVGIVKSYPVGLYEPITIVLDNMHLVLKILTVYSGNNLLLRGLAYIRYNYLIPVRACYPHYDDLLPKPRLVYPLKVVIILPHSGIPRLIIDADL